MARRSLRSGLLAGTLALALIASGCGDSKEGSDGTKTTEASGKSNDLAKVDCGSLEYDKDAPKGGTFTDYAYLSDSGTNTSFDPGVVQTLSESQITTAMFDGLVDFDFTVLQDQIFEGIRQILGEKSPMLDIFRLQDSDPARQRYE